MLKSGRAVRLELNVQRVTEAMDFYRSLFGWRTLPMHVSPWGSIPQIANGDRVFGNEFMAMGAFAPPHWKVWFSADLERAEAAVREGGGDTGQGIYTLGTLGRLLDTKDPAGNSVGAIELSRPPPGTDAVGDPCLAEFWGCDVSKHAGFHAKTLGLECTRQTTGAKLSDGKEPRIFYRDVPFDLPMPILVPYFMSAGVGGDCERARRAGAVVQVHQETVEDMGARVVLSDPAGAFFGLVGPE